MEEKKNWPAIFVAFSNGSAEADICREFSLSVPELRQRAKSEGWGLLKERLPVSAAISTTDFGQESIQRLELIKANRERNLNIINKLKDDLESVVDDLLTGKLTVVEFKTTKDGVHELERPMGVKDRNALATYAEQIFKMGYEALGDSAALKGGGDPAAGGLGGGKGDGGPRNVVFQINMPGAISQPRPVTERPVQTYDVDTEKTSTP